MDSLFLDQQFSPDLLHQFLSQNPSFFDSDALPAAVEKRKPSDDSLLPPEQKRRGLPQSPPTKKQGRRLSKTDPDSKRKAQNRAAQRAFRERKENHVRELESRIAQLEAQNASIGSENSLLKSRVEKLQSDLRLLKSSPFTFEYPLPLSTISALPPAADISSSFLSTTSLPPHKNGEVTDSSFDSTSSTHTSPDTAHTDPEIPGKVRSEADFCSLFSAACGNVDNPNPVLPNTADVFDESLFGPDFDLDDTDLDTILVGQQDPKAKYLSCSQVWKKVTQLPAYEVIDIDQICEDLRRKVVCSAKGAICPEFVVENELNKLSPFARQQT